MPTIEWWGYPGIPKIYNFRLDENHAIRNSRREIYLEPRMITTGMSAMPGSEAIFQYYRF